jgi:SAM-dependent methyltransferase
MPNSEELVLSIGGGMTKYPGAKIIDVRPFEGVDYVFDVTKDRFPFKDSTVDLIIAHHVFEHLGWTAEEDGLIHCIEECFRVLKPTGHIDFEVPRFPSDAAIAHPEHRRFFVPNSFAFFQVPANGIDVHGYLKGFWHCGIDPDRTNENIVAGVMYPNKPKGRFDYTKVRRVDQEEK